MSGLLCMVGLASGILAALAPAAELVTDEATRLEALSAIFSKMSIRPMPGKRIDHSLGFAGNFAPLYFPDAFKEEKVYRVVGGRYIYLDGCAPGENLSKKRDVRFQLFHVRDALFLLVLQYTFSHAAAAKVCESVASAFLLSRGESAWTVNAEEPYRGHGDINSIEFADLNDDGIADLILEEDERTNATVMTSTVWIFDLSLGRFDRISGMLSRSYSRWPPSDYVSMTILDIERSLAEKTRRFCFTSTEFTEKGAWLTPPRVTYPCFRP